MSVEVAAVLLGGLWGCVPDCQEGYEEDSLGVCSPIPPGETPSGDSGNPGTTGTGTHSIGDDCLNPRTLSGTMDGDALTMETLAWSDNGVGAIAFGFEEEGHACELAADSDDVSGVVLSINLDTRGEPLEVGYPYEVRDPEGAGPGGSDPVAVVSLRPPDAEPGEWRQASAGSVTITAMAEGGVLVVEDVTLEFDDDTSLSGAFEACACAALEEDQGEGGTETGKRPE